MPKELFEQYSLDRRGEAWQEGALGPKQSLQDDLITDPRIIRHSKYSSDQGGKPSLRGKNVWAEMECGLVLSAVSQWDLTIRSKSNKNGTMGWICQHCSQFWQRKRGGSRMLTISDATWEGDDRTVVQVICGEPPQTEWTAWCKSRCEFYMRFEPNEPLRDAPPSATGEIAQHRLRMDGVASDMVWQGVLSSPDKQLLNNLEKLFLATSHH